MSLAGAKRWARSTAARPEAAVLLLVTGTNLLGRAWVRAGADPLVWNDSADYLEAASTGLLTGERLVGSRPVLMPLVLSAASLDLARFALWQTLVASLAWGVLAAVTWRVVAHRGVRIATVVVLAAWSLTWPASMWDQQVLTESLAISTLVGATAAGLWFAHRPSARTGAVLVVTCGLVLLARDSTAIPVALVGLALVVAALVRRSPRRTVVGLTGAYLLALSFVLVGTARLGERNVAPLEHAYAVRVLPYPDRVRWFEAHGMPQGAALEAIEEARDPVLDLAPFTPVPPVPEWEPWRRWLERDGQEALARYALAHPGYVLGEPMASPERVFNNVAGLEGYRPLDQRDVPGADLLASVDTTVVALVAAAAAFVLGMVRPPVRPAAAVGALLVVTAAPHGLLVWHLDGMESARHLLLPGVQLRLGAVLLVAAAADAALAGARGTGRSRPARSPGPPQARRPRPA
jgi:hypothetical protein